MSQKGLHCVPLEEVSTEHYPHGMKIDFCTRKSAHLQVLHGTFFSLYDNEQTLQCNLQSRSKDNFGIQNLFIMQRGSRNA
jgi:hypothetical protein